MVPPLPPTLPVRFEPDAFVCTLRGRDLLVSLGASRWLLAAIVLATLAAMLAIGPLGRGVLLLLPLLLPTVIAALAKLWRLAVSAMLSAPSRTVLRCDHEHVTARILVHGILRERVVVPLSELARCEVAHEGLRLYRADGTLAARIVAEVPLRELLWVASMIEDAIARRATFEQDERAPERLADRLAALRLVQREI